MKNIEEIRRETRIPTVIADHQGLITFVNERFTEVFVWKLGEILGRPLTVIIPKNLHDAHHLGFSRFLATGKATLLNQPLKLRAVGKDGREFDAEHVIVAEKQEGRWLFGATVQPLAPT